MKMLPEKILIYFLYFSIMAFVGWIIETVYRSSGEKKFVNAGFLSGPFLPIYGFGAVLLTSINTEVQKFHGIISWIITLLSPTVLEYFGSWVMEKIFKLKLWDYNNERFNLHGRICLKFSIIWAFLAVIHLLVIQPMIFKRIIIVGPYYSHFIAGGLFTYFVLDVNYSIRSLLNFKDFQNNILRLIEKKKEFIPAFDFNLGGRNSAKKLPNEIRRILKPLSAFPNLRKSFKEKSFVFPGWINELLEKRFKK
jgi:uncharacterized membrane protein